MKYVPPYATMTNELNITINFKPTNILSLDDANRILTFTAYSQMSWTDLDLTWNPADFANQQNLHVTPGDIWTPKLMVTNSADSISTDSNYNVYIYFTGFVMMETFSIYRVTCDINVKNYPFDEQRCKMTISPEYGYGFGINPKVTDIPLDKYFSVNGEWELLDTKASLMEISQTGIDHSYAEFTMILKRQSDFYVVSVIFPMTLLSVMNSFVFILPAESGEKISYLISIFVSHAVFLNYINDVMPKTSVSNLSIYLCLVLIQSCLALMVTLVVLSRHHSKSNDVTVLAHVASSRCRCWNVSLDHTCFIFFLLLALISTFLLFM